MLYALPLIFALVGLALYAVLGGADFGAGFWQLTAGWGRRGREVRDFAHHAMGPVWEANHVWLVFVLTVMWTAYPSTFASIASTLAIPLSFAVVGIVFRGTTYALRAGTRGPREEGAVDTIFSVASSARPSSRCASASRSARIAGSEFTPKASPLGSDCMPHTSRG